MAAEFVHLHVHSQYSFLTSAVKLSDLPGKAKALGMSGVALTDVGNMYGAIRHYKGCKQSGLTPLLGAEMFIPRGGSRTGALDHLVLLAENQEGYKNLVRIVSEGHLRSAHDYAPAVTLDFITERNKGLVALSGCMAGVVAQRILEQGVDQAEPTLAEFRDRFEPGHFFVELQDHGFPEQPVLADILLKAAGNLNLPVVASNDVHFMTKDDGIAALYLECVGKGRTFAEEQPLHHNSFEMYLKTPDEMAALFGGVPGALENTLKVQEMCSALKLELDKPMLPQFPVPEGYDTDGYFRHVSSEGLEKRLAHFRTLGKKVNEAEYRERLEIELGVIIGMKYPGYFLIVWDFIREAKARGIPVGPGRGSGAGSIVAYSLEITEIDPIPYALLFERFLNPERVSMPDFDVDFCMSRRDEVIRYVAEKYGVDSVGQIATFQNLKARSVIKDVARAMGFAATEAQRIASMVPDKGQGKTYTIDEALVVEPKLKALADSDPRVFELLGHSRKLEGLTRHAGMHAAGVVISDGALTEHVPCFKSDTTIVTQYDKDDVEAAGLVKFDFLGLKTLTVIDIAQKLVNARPDRRNNPLDLGKILLDDKATYQLISSGETTGVFQLESSGMQQLLKRLQPDVFEDIVAVVALYRPGPLGTGMIDDFILSKHGKKAIRKLHPLVDEVLAPTYGVPVYQEQVMQIAQHLAGYTLGGADMLRRAMGKKKAEEMQKQEATFIAGALAKGVPEEQSSAIFKEIEGFASYGFNKSHSAAYALVTYHTAYLKAHYPTEFFAALMTADKEKIEKVVRTIAEARAWGVAVLPPDINLSAVDFTVVYQHPDGRGPQPRGGPGKLRDRFGPQIRFGLGAVRGVGESALETMFEARSGTGAFVDLFDLATRVDSKRLNKGVLESLVQCGAFDTVLEPKGITRARAYAAVDRALERSRSASRDRERGQTNLFGMFGGGSGGAAAAAGDEYPMAVEWDRMELLKRERAALGCYVSGHPLFRYQSKLSRIGALGTLDLAGQKPWSAASVAGMVENYQEKIFKGSGARAAFFEIEDQYGRVEAKVRGDRIETYSAILTCGEPVIVSGKVSFPMTEDADEERVPTLLVDGVELLSDAALRATRAITIRLDAERTGRSDLEKLKVLLLASPGSCPVELVLSMKDGAEAVLDLPGTRVTPDGVLLGGLERTFGGPVAELR